MRFNTHYRPAHSLTVVELGPNETVRAEASAMISMTRNIRVATTGPMNRSTGGFFGGLKRAFLGGETFFTNTFTAENGPGHVTLAPALTGDMLVHELAQNHQLFIQGGSYVAAPDSVQLDTKWQGMKGFFSGESLFFLNATGYGPVLMNAFGAVQTIVHLGAAVHGVQGERGVDQELPFRRGLRAEIHRPRSSLHPVA
jgi:uncharacterized protein (TIGR00266 family)